METEIDMEAVRRALQLTTNEMHEVHLIRHYKPTVKADPPVVGYSLKFDRDAELTASHLWALAAVFGTRSIRAKYIPSDVDGCGFSDQESELTIEVWPDA